MTAAATDLRDPGFAAALRSEWTKFVSLRSVRVTLVLGIVLGMTATGLAGWAVLATWDDWPAEDRAEFAVADYALVGMLVTGVLFTVLGVTAVSSEYSSRMTMLTFTATPRRERVLAAKVLVVAGVTFVATLVAVTGMIMLAQAVFAGLDRPAPDLGRATRMVLGIGANAALFSVLAVSLTFVVRSAAGSVAALLGLTFGPAVLGPVLPRWWAEHGQDFLPGPAMDSLTFPGLTEGEGLGVGVAALVVAAWLGVFVGGALVALLRRDA